MPRQTAQIAKDHNKSPRVGKAILRWPGTPTADHQFLETLHGERQLHGVSGQQATQPHQNPILVLEIRRQARTAIDNDLYLLAPSAFLLVGKMVE
jgi:hypothetical protein